MLHTNLNLRMLMLAFPILIAGCGGGSESSDGAEVSSSSTPQTNAVTVNEDGVAPPNSNAPGETGNPPTVSPTSPVPAPPTDPQAMPVELVVRGSLSWRFVGSIPEDKRAAITNAMDSAVNFVNTVAAYGAVVNVMYNPGVRTAQGTYNNNITFGGSISGWVALHEMSHWLGVGSHGAWGGLVVGGRYTGTHGLAQMRAYLGPDASIGADRQHFWPYGWNSASEAGSPQRHVAMVSAFRRDMGLSNGMSRERLAGTFRLVNRSSSLLLAAPTGAQAGTVPVLAVSVDNTLQQWAMEPADGFVTLRNISTGLLLDGTGATTDGAETSLRGESLNTVQQWEMLPTTEGYFMLRNRATDRCIDNLSVQTAGARIAVLNCNGNANQQWHLAR